jgi:hypothetical protein
MSNRHKPATERTGIFLRAGYYRDSGTSPEAYLRAVNDLSGSLLGDSGSQLSHARIWDVVEIEAKQIVEAHEKDKWPWPAADRVETVNDATSFLDFLGHLREGCHDSDSAACCAFFLGMFTTRMGVREHEPDATRGKRQEKHLRRMRDKAHGTREEIAARYRSYYDHYCELRTTGLGKVEAMNVTARHFKLKSAATIRRARKKFEKLFM